MKEIMIEERFFDSNRWESGKECLNMEDINEPPTEYLNNKEHWINELTTFITLYPTEWRCILEEYRALTNKRSTKVCNQELVYFRDDEGELRRKGEKDIYLRVYFKTSLNIKSLSEIGEQITNRWGFVAYEEFCNLPLSYRSRYVHRLYNDIVQMLNIRNIDGIHVSYANDFDESDFQKRDLYIDQLNHSFIIL